jgi:hypothetical protein
MVLGHNATHRHAQGVAQRRVVGNATWLTVAAVAALGVAGVRALYGRLRDDAWQRDLDRLMGRD